MRLSVKKIAILGLLGAICTSAQVAIAFLPNIELVSLLVVIYAHALGAYVFAPVFVFVLTEGLIYGFGIWWINYLYVWPILAAAALLLQHAGRRHIDRHIDRHTSRYAVAALNGAFGLCFGALCALPYFFIGGAPAALSYWLSGIPFDLVHGASNAVVAVLLFTPLDRLFSRVLSLSSVTFR